MALRYYTNSARTSLSTAITSSQTTIQVVSAAALPVQFPYTLIIDREETSEEVVEVTSASGNVLTVIRGADGTTAFSHIAGAAVGHGFSARDLREPNTHINNNAGVHGVTGNVVGTSDSQTLTNKNLASDTNTFPSTFATTSTAQALTNKDLSSPTNSFPTDILTADNVATVTNKDFSSPTNTFPVAGSGLPAGTIVMWPGLTAPAGWLLCDGAAKDRTEQANIFNVIGTLYGSGDGVSTFNLPDLRVRLPIGVGTNIDLAENEGWGETSRSSLLDHSHSHTGSGFSSSSFGGGHTHGVSEFSAGGHSHSVSGSTSTVGSHSHDAGSLSVTTVNDKQPGSGVRATANVVGSTGSAGSHSHSVSAGTDFESSHTHSVSVSSGGDHSHSISTSVSIGTGGSSSHPYLGLNYIIKT